MKSGLKSTRGQKTKRAYVTQDEQLGNCLSHFFFRRLQAAQTRGARLGAAGAVAWIEVAVLTVIIL